MLLVLVLLTFKACIHFCSSNAMPSPILVTVHDFVAPIASSNVMLVHCSVCVSAHTVLIMDFKILGEMCKCAMRHFQHFHTCFHAREPSGEWYGMLELCSGA